ncbi:MAG: hypothetical protein AMXMBFR12_07310 [Candidatus Babeliales bacterium]
MKKNGSIILLNGTSSSGKSSVLKELEKIVPHAAFLHVDDYYDDEVIQTAQNLGWKETAYTDPWHFINQYLADKTGKYYFDTEVRQQLFTASDFFYSKAKSAMAHGKTVFIDTVLEYPSAYQHVFDYFKDDHFSMILIYCPMSVILKRVQERNNCGIPSEHRSPFLPFEHFITMYKLRNNLNEPLVDVVSTITLKYALETAIQDVIQAGISTAYLPKLQKFKEDFISQFKLEQADTIEITPQYQYLAIFKNDTIDKPKIIAQEIKDIIPKL